MILNSFRCLLNKWKISKKSRHKNILSIQHSCKSKIIIKKLKRRLDSFMIILEVKKLLETNFDNKTNCKITNTKPRIELGCMFMYTNNTWKFIYHIYIIKLSDIFERSQKIQKNCLNWTQIICLQYFYV